jgi:hypothetical protein
LSTNSIGRDAAIEASPILAEYVPTPKPKPKPKPKP